MSINYINPRFLNGGNSDPNNLFPGVQASSFQDALVIIRDTWTSTGAVTFQDDIANNLLVMELITADGQKIYARFTKEIPLSPRFTGHIRILIQLDIYGDGVYLSPATWDSAISTTNAPIGTHSMGLEFSESGGTIWGGFDQDAMAILVRDPNGWYDSIAGGFLDRLYPNEVPLSALICKPDWRVLNCYFATHPLKSGFWHNAGDDFSYPDRLDSRNCSAIYKKLFDEMAALNANDNYYYLYPGSRSTTRNPAYQSHQGKKNLFDKLLISEDYAYFLAYPYSTDDMSFNPILLGYVKFLWRGVGRLAPGLLTPSPRNSNEWIISAGRGNPMFHQEDGYQGILISR